MTSKTRAPNVLVTGALLGQEMGGVRRHNAELLSRANRKLAAGGGRLAILEGRTKIRLPHPEQYECLKSDVPDSPPWARARHESKAIKKALREAQPTPFDLLHTGHLPAPHGLGIPITLTLHDLRKLERFPQRLVAAPILADSIRRAAAVITVSETVRAQVEARFRTTRTWVVPNAADHLQVLARRPVAEPFLLHVGHLEPRKNLELLLHALARDPGLPPLKLAGGAKGGAQQRLEALARNLGVSERVCFLGPVAEERLAMLYAECAAAVFPSRIEGFGIGVVEALRASAPVAIANAGALPEIAGSGVPRFAPDDASECARAIRATLGLGEEQLEEMAQGAERYSWERSAALLVDIWMEIARATTAASRPH